MVNQLSSSCKWHEGEEMLAIDQDGIGCPECGRMIATQICEGCHNEYLDWLHKGWDDIIAGPAVTSSGDFCCTHCLPRIEREMEEQEEEDTYDYGWGGEDY
jgi:hypothetical protein